MSEHRTLDSVPISEIKLGQVTYVKKSDTLFVVCGLHPEFPGSDTPRESIVDLLSEHGKISNILLTWGDNQILLEKIIPEEKWIDYLQELKSIRESL